MRIKNIFRIASLLLVSLSVFFLGCSKSEDENNEGGSTHKLNKNDVVGSYYFEGYSGPLERRLEIYFDDDYTGYGKEESYGSKGNWLSTHEYTFNWKISGNKVLLKGFSASAHSDGGIGANDSWSAEFVYAYDMLLPGDKFIEGYAEKAIKDMLERELQDLVDCTATFYEQNGIVRVEVNAERFKSHWENISLYCGYSYDYTEPVWYPEDGETLTLDIAMETSLYRRILKALMEKINNGEVLSDGEKDMLRMAQEGILEEERAFEKGDWDYAILIHVTVHAPQNTFTYELRVIPQYIINKTDVLPG